MNEILIQALISLATGIVGWFAARRKNLAETRVSEIDAVERAVKVWRELSEDLQRRQEELQKEMDKLRLELDTLRSENRRLLSDMKHLKKSSENH